MGVITYAIFAFALTALISVVVTAIIVLVSRFTNKPENVEDDE